MDEVPSHFSRGRDDQSQRSKPWAQFKFVTFQPHLVDRTGPGPDHPVFSNCRDSRYLKVLWARVV